MFKKQSRERQEEFWKRIDELILLEETPFWMKFQGFIDNFDFERQARQAYAQFHSSSGPGQHDVDPVAFLKKPLIAFSKQLHSDRVIEVRCVDSLGIQTILAITLTERVLDHLTQNRIRHHLTLEVLHAVRGIIFLHLHKLRLICCRRWGWTLG
ncbi:MAG: transposase [Bacteroidota bacterium]|jgi:hypothetical protein